MPENKEKNPTINQLHTKDLGRIGSASSIESSTDISQKQNPPNSLHAWVVTERMTVEKS